MNISCFSSIVMKLQDESCFSPNVTKLQDEAPNSASKAVKDWLSKFSDPNWNPWENTPGFPSFEDEPQGKKFFNCVCIIQIPNQSLLHRIGLLIYTSFLYIYCYLYPFKWWSRLVITSNSWISSILAIMNTFLCF